VRRLEVTKCKDHEKPDVLRFRIVSVEVDGVSTPVLQLSKVPVGRLGKNMRTGLKVLKEHAKPIDDGRKILPLSKWKELTDLQANRFDEASKSLITGGLVGTSSGFVWPDLSD
jgi:hypothetical protein